MSRNRKWMFSWWWGMAVILLAASGCAHSHGEPWTRDFVEDFIEPERADWIVVTDVEHRADWRRLPWCYGFETGRAEGRFCAAEDLGYQVGDRLELELRRTE